MESNSYLATLYRELAVEQHNMQARQDARELIQPLTATDRAAKCASCHHLKRYHTETNGILKCKYETCATRCRGFVQYKPKGER
jgi:cytochrome c553